MGKVGEEREADKNTQKGMETKMGRRESEEEEEEKEER